MEGGVSNDREREENGEWITDRELGDHANKMDSII